MLLVVDDVPVDNETHVATSWILWSADPAFVDAYRGRIYVLVFLGGVCAYIVSICVVLYNCIILREKKN